MDKLGPIRLAKHSFSHNGGYLKQTRRPLSVQLLKPRKAKLDKSHMIGWRATGQAENRFVLEQPEPNCLSRPHSHPMVDLLPAKRIQVIHHQVVLAYPCASTGEYGVKLLQAGG